MHITQELAVEIIAHTSGKPRTIRRKDPFSQTRIEKLGSEIELRTLLALIGKYDTEGIGALRNKLEGLYSMATNAAVGVEQCLQDYLGKDFVIPGSQGTGAGPKMMIALSTEILNAIAEGREIPGESASKALF